MDLAEYDVDLGAAMKKKLWWWKIYINKQPIIIFNFALKCLYFKLVFK